MEKRDLICIGCPLGCMLNVSVIDGEVAEIKGNTCKRGESYARKEVTNPTRIVTSSVIVDGGCIAVVSVKTEMDIPKDKIVECMKALKGVRVNAPVHIGDIIVENIGDTGVNMIATKNVGKCI